MGYDICTTPGARWFAIQPTMLRAEKLFRALPTESSSVRDLCDVFSVRLAFARAISLMVGQVPISGDVEKVLRSAAQSQKAVAMGCREYIEAFAAPEFQVSYGGSGQYGVPNYTFHCGDETENATGGGGKLSSRAYSERLENAKSLKKRAVLIFFEVYWEERKYDLTYYSYWENKEIEEILTEVIAAGVFNTEHDAKIACEGVLEDLCRIPAVQELGKERQRDDWLQYFESNWDEFEETASIWHGHSN